MNRFPLAIVAVAVFGFAGQAKAALVIDNFSVGEFAAAGGPDVNGTAVRDFSVSERTRDFERTVSFSQVSTVRDGFARAEVTGGDTGKLKLESDLAVQSVGVAWSGLTLDAGQASTSVAEFSILDFRYEADGELGFALYNDYKVRSIGRIAFSEINPHSILAIPFNNILAETDGFDPGDVDTLLFSTGGVKSGFLFEIGEVRIVPEPHLRCMLMLVSWALMRDTRKGTAANV